MIKIVMCHWRIGTADKFCEEHWPHKVDSALMSYDTVRMERARALFGHEANKVVYADKVPDYIEFDTDKRWVLGNGFALFRLKKDSVRFHKLFSR